MPIKNVKTLLVDATQYPAAIEAMLPAGAPKVSAMLADAASKIPAVPDFPIELPDLPAAPALSAMPGGAALRRFVTGAEVRAVAGAPAPARGGLIPFVYE